MEFLLGLAIGVIAAHYWPDHPWLIASVALGTLFALALAGGVLKFVVIIFEEREKIRERERQEIQQ